MLTTTIATGNGIGSVAPSAQANYSIDYMGAVTVFQQFPLAHL